MLKKFNQMSNLFENNRKENTSKCFEDILNTFCNQIQKVNSDYYISEIDFHFQNAKELFFEMVQMNFFDVRYHIECEDENYSFTFFEDRCSCGKKVNAHQNIMSLYCIQGDVRSFISDRNKEKLKYDSEIWKKNRTNLDELKMGSQLVPFIGSGLSTPYGLPDWTSLVKLMSNTCSKETLEGINYFLSRKDFLSCFKAILDDHENQTIKDVSALKRKISELFSIRNIDLNRDSNYPDVLSIGLPLIVTTNYDEILDKLGKESYESVVFKNSEDIKSIESCPTILHLHGSAGFQDKRSMVVTEEDYNEIYKNEIYQRKIQSLLGNKTILFLGYSLDDYHFMNELMNICESNAGFVDYYAFMINVDYGSLQQKIPDYYAKIKLVSLEIETPVNGEKIIEMIRSYLKYINNSLFLEDI